AGRAPRPPGPARAPRRPGAARPDGAGPRLLPVRQDLHARGGDPPHHGLQPRRRTRRRHRRLDEGRLPAREGPGASLLAYADPVEPRGVLVRDRAALGGGHTLEHLGDDLPRAGPVAPVVGVVRRPHERLEPDRVAVLHTVFVDDEGEHPVRAHVLARLALELVLGPVLVPVVTIVHLFGVVRDPADARLHRDEAELREAVVDARENDLAHDEWHGIEAGAAQRRDLPAARALPARRLLLHRRLRLGRHLGTR